MATKTRKTTPKEPTLAELLAQKQAAGVAYRDLPRALAEAIKQAEARDRQAAAEARGAAIVKHGQDALTDAELSAAFAAIVAKAKAPQAAPATGIDQVPVLAESRAE